MVVGDTGDSVSSRQTDTRLTEPLSTQGATKISFITPIIPTPTRGPKHNQILSNGTNTCMQRSCLHGEDLPSEARSHPTKAKQ